jgi:peroxiredoxin
MRVQAEEPIPMLARRVLVDTRARSTSLAAQAGSGRLVVVVMKGVWCQVCADQLARFDRLQGELTRLQTRVVGLSNDSPDANALLKHSQGLSCELLADPTLSVLQELGLWRPAWGHPLPAIVVFDRCGAERGRLLGRQPGVTGEAAVLDLLEELARNPAKCAEPTT